MANKSTNITNGSIDVSYVHEFTSQDISARQYSTLDLCSPSSFTLIVDKNSKLVTGTVLAQVVSVVKDKGIPLGIYVYGCDFECETLPSSQKWKQLLGLTQGNAVIVRPDQHILAVVREDEEVATIVALIQEHLGTQ